MRVSWLGLQAAKRCGAAHGAGACGCCPPGVSTAPRGMHGCWVHHWHSSCVANAAGKECLMLQAVPLLHYLMTVHYNLVGVT